MRAVLPACMNRGTKIITNQGWINPDAAQRQVVHWLREFGYTGVKVASVNGSLITEHVLELTDRILENGQPTATLTETLISAEAYLGAEPIVEALKAGAQIVVTGRVADPSIFLAPMMFEFGWDPLDHAKIRTGHGPRTFARMWRTGHRRILLRSGLQGCAGALEFLAFPSAKCGWQRGNYQGRRHRRRGQSAHGQGTDVVRGA